MSQKPDIEIARAASMLPILEVAGRLGIAEFTIPYGKTKAKVDYAAIDACRPTAAGKLILMTAVSPTPAGEGKTTTTIGLGDALNRIGRKAAICLREPSLGPCFGMKGGACWRRLRAGRADDRYQPALHRGLSRCRRRAQSARRAD